MTNTVGDVFVDRHRKRHGLLEHHAHFGAQAIHRVILVENILAIELDRAFGFQLRINRVDAIEDAKQGGFATTGWPDDRSDLLLGNVHVDAFQRMVSVVVEVHIAHFDLGRRSGAGQRRRSGGGEVIHNSPSCAKT
jgi:hypothetical protein